MSTSVSWPLSAWLNTPCKRWVTETSKGRNPRRHQQAVNNNNNVSTFCFDSLFDRARWRPRHRVCYTSIPRAASASWGELYVALVELLCRHTHAHAWTHARTQQNLHDTAVLSSCANVDNLALGRPLCCPCEEVIQEVGEGNHRLVVEVKVHRCPLFPSRKACPPVLVVSSRAHRLNETTPAATYATAAARRKLPSFVLCCRSSHHHHHQPPRPYTAADVVR